MEKEIGSFRKSAFGGFNRKDVISYIEKMRNETHEYKLQVEETVKDLNKKICELEGAASLISELDREGASVSSPSSVTLSSESVGDIRQATVQLKLVADELCKNLGDFIEKLTHKGLFDQGKIMSDETEDFDFSAEGEKVSADEVSLILSAMSFIDQPAKNNRRAEKKAVEDTVDIGKLLASLSFLG